MQNFHPLCQNVLDDLSVNVSEPIIPSLEAMSQLFVIESEQMEYGGMQVVNVDLVLGYSKTQFVTGSMNEPTLGSASGQHHGVDVGKVVTTQVLAFRSATFPERSPPEFVSRCRRMVCRPEVQDYLQDSSVLDEGPGQPE